MDSELIPVEFGLYELWNNSIGNFLKEPFAIDDEQPASCVLLYDSCFIFLDRYPRIFLHFVLSTSN